MTGPEKGSDAADIVKLEEWLPVLRDRTLQAARSTGAFASGMARVYVAMRPLASLINRRADVSEEELHLALDTLFEALSQHPLVGQLRDLTQRLREDKILPNEESTENLLRFLIDQITARSVVPIPDQLTDEFWAFFNELMSEPELQGLGEVSLDVLRIVTTAYEPLMVELINQLKHLRRNNNRHMREIMQQTRVVRSDLEIFRRQIGALAYIRAFFDLEPDDLLGQAEVVAAMVREFGPFFIKMAQVAASSSEFLPDEMADALSVFQDDVEPMSPSEVEQAFMESFGEMPGDRYYQFDAAKPLKSGSIASVYLAQRPLTRRGGRQVLSPVVVKVGRHNLEREFVIGQTVIKLAILSSHYWAPHSKLAPFLDSWLEQVDVFVDGFRAELDFETEAAVQARFAERAVNTGGWHVPRVFHATRRIIEMEYVEGGKNLTTAFDGMKPRRAARLRRRTGKAFLHTVLSHMLVYQEFHGDLHPGNILLGPRDRLYLIDWGNSVDISGIWRPTLRYVQAILAGDAAAITDAMIDLGTHPQDLLPRRREILGLVKGSLEESGVSPLGIDFPLTLYREGVVGLQRRAELALNLATLMGRQGIVVNSQYMHLTRSFTAMVGSFMGIYSSLPRWALAQDVAEVLAWFPSLETYRQANGYRRRLARQIARDLAGAVNGRRSPDA
ncbi:MAG: AarF/ABC1/UbiB kinase family protein [Pseudomonadota bacterium]